MLRHHRAQLGLLMVLAPWFIAGALVAAYFLAISWAQAGSCPCTTDTECMLMHGGDGGPESEDWEV